MELKEMDMAYQRWLTIYPHMIIPISGQKKPPLKFIGFDKYYKQLKSPNKPKTNKSAEEIIKEIEKVIEHNKKASS